MVKAWDGGEAWGLRPAAASGAEIPGQEATPAPATADAPPAAVPHPWPLARGVGLLEGTLAGAEGPGSHVYALVLPSGRRFQVSEPLYRLAELLRGRLPAEEVAARLGARVGRPLSAADLSTLVATKLAPHGVVSER
ncbi:MAG TPA: hypothetical protein VII06_24435 [Chloroflexota bacterium]|jgi:hypothetical protein